MPIPTTAAERTRRRLRLVPPILFLGAVLVGALAGLNVIGLFDLDEGFYASVARTMVETGDWLTPRIGDAVFFDKPPLLYWLQAMSMQLLGFTPTAARLPAALSIALTAGLLWWWASRHGITRVGWVAALLLLLSPMGVAIARQGIMDGPLTLLQTAAMLAAAAGLVSNRRWFLVFAACCALALLTKGLIGVLLPCIAVLVWTGWRRDWKRLAGMPWLSAIFVFLVIALPWHLAIYQQHGSAWFDEYIIRQHLARFKGAEFGHVAPFWTYIPILWFGLFPWSALTPAAWWRRLSAGRQTNDPAAASISLLAIWALVVFVFFSISRSKLPGYIMPAVPALAVCTAYRLVNDWNRRNTVSAFETGLLGFSGIAAALVFTTAGALGLMWASPPPSQFMGKPLSANLYEPVIAMAPFALMLSGWCLLTSLTVAIRRHTVPRMTGAILLAGFVLPILFIAYGFPAWNSYDIAPLHQLATRGRELAIKHRVPMAVYDLHPGRPSVLFVTGAYLSDDILDGRQSVLGIDNKEQLTDLLKRSQNHSALVLAESSNVPQIEQYQLTPVTKNGRWGLWMAEPDQKQSAANTEGAGNRP